MTKSLTKYCIMTEDESQIEVGLSKHYYFELVENIFSGKCKAQIKFFSTINMAKSAFSASFRTIWDDELQCFRNRYEGYDKTRYIIKEVEVVYNFKD